MTDEYKEWERQCDEIRRENDQLLNDFQQGLTGKGLKPKTVQNHLGNVDFYINHYLLYYDPVRPPEGDTAILFFFEYWFPRKAMWASPANVKSMAASIKKFYQFLFEQGKVDEDAVQELKAEIRASLPDWMEAAEF
ncbi:MAG: recombinase [Proteobacteria bacterium]|nr:recombinase [Pseudomonadota bacterium]